MQPQPGVARWQPDPEDAAAPRVLRPRPRERLVNGLAADRCRQADSHDQWNSRYGLVHVHVIVIPVLCMLALYSISTKISSVVTSLQH